MNAPHSITAYKIVYRAKSLLEAERVEAAVREVCAGRTDIVSGGSLYEVVTTPADVPAALSRIERSTAAGWL